MLKPTPLALSAPELGKMQSIAEGVYWVRMPLPLRLAHVNLWVLRDGEGWMIVDTGLAYDPAKQGWAMLLADIMDKGPVTRLLATHYHPDHVGLAGWLHNRLRCDFLMPEAEWLAATLSLTMTSRQNGAGLRRLGRRLGFSLDDIQKLAKVGAHYRNSVSPLPPAYQRIFDGQRLRINGSDWHVIMGYGHAMEHACLYCPERKILIAGDHVLPEITPNVSTHWFNGWTDPLSGFLETNARLKRLVADDTIVLPSHRQPFHGLHQRLDELALHHKQRLDQTLEIMENLPKQQGSASDVLPLLFPMKLDGFSMMFAAGETEAHLRHLFWRGDLDYSDKRGLYAPIWRYRLADKAKPRPQNKASVNELT